jgi:hypothetical protein
MPLRRRRFVGQPKGDGLRNEMAGEVAGFEI